MPGFEEQECKGLLAMQHSHEAGKPFHCLICLELVYKPVVQPCGHVFCFWCVHRAMNRMRQSQCPLCRRPYLHFPQVCVMLHFFLMKEAPDEYNRRAEETEAMERSNEVYSPRVFESPNCLGRLCKNQKSPKSSPLSNAQSPQQLLDAESLCQGECIGSCVTSQDFICSSCDGFLYRPVVLMCGQVLCESCVMNVQHCPVCRCSHPGSSIQVCLELDQYLERAFPEEYAKRKEETFSNVAQHNDKVSETREPNEQLARDMEEKFEGEEWQVIHEGTGCDGCGMYPIVGRQRYKCLDCLEKVGYDLCGSCYTKSLSDEAAGGGGGLIMIGRFNQQHQPQHRMQQMAPPSTTLILPTFNLDLSNGTIQRRRLLSQQHVIEDFNEYIESFL